MSKPEQSENIDEEVLERMAKALGVTAENHFKEMDDHNHRNFKVFDSVRGVLSEDDPAFPGAGIKKKSHIQFSFIILTVLKASLFQVKGSNSPYDSAILSIDTPCFFVTAIQSLILLLSGNLF